MEPTPEAYVAALVEVFREVRRMLRKDGTLWLNLGDCYCAAPQGSWNGTDKSALTKPDGANNRARRSAAQSRIKSFPGLKSKDLLGIPWRVAFALQADGWWLRQRIVWVKPNPMPESVRDRCTVSCEDIFMLTRSARYFYDADAIATRAAPSSIERLSQPTLSEQIGSSRANGGAKTNGRMKAVFGGRNKHEGYGNRKASGNEDDGRYIANGVNARNVWIVAASPYRGAHFATFPPEIPRRCILAGSRPGDTVLDPFAGAGTTVLVAERLGRGGIGIELNADYVALIRRRIAEDAPLFSSANEQEPEA